MIPPIDLLFALLLTTAGAVCIDWFLRGRQHVMYRKLAAAYQMHYSARDSLRLAPRVAAALPIVGAAAVRVIDLMYRSDDAAHHYVFTAEYTVGVIGPKTRVRRAAAFSEKKGTGPNAVVIRLGASDQPLAEQYAKILSDGETAVGKS